MNISLAKQKSDPRVNQLLGRASVARVQHKEREADRLEDEAESVLVEDQRVEEAEERTVRLNVYKPKTVVVRKVAPKVQELKAKAQVQEKVVAGELNEEEGAAVKRRAPLQDRTRLLAMVGQLPTFNPLSKVFQKQGQTDSASSESAQFGLAGAGAGLMAVEPAAGGILLMFSCILHAVTDDSVQDEQEDKTELDPEALEESQEAGLFTAGTNAMKWIIA